MIKKFVEAFDKRREVIKADLASKQWDDYSDLFSLLVRHLHDEMDGDYYAPDPSRITSIDHGDCQGSLVFVVGATGYQPNSYWGCVVSYGSCSGCDTLQGISDYSSDPPSPEQVEEYFQLVLNMLQRLRPIHSGEDATSTRRTVP